MTFKNLYSKAVCPNCVKKVLINFYDKKILIKGFVCPWCEEIVEVGDIWESLIIKRNANEK